MAEIKDVCRVPACVQLFLTLRIGWLSSLHGKNQTPGPLTEAILKMCLVPALGEVKDIKKNSQI